MMFRRVPPSRLALFGNWPRAGQALLRAERRSVFVRRQLERSPVTAWDAAHDPEAWRQLPFVTKDDLVADQRLAPPFGTRCCARLEDISVLLESSGDSALGKETHYITRRDYATTLRAWARSLRRMGIAAADTVALALPVGLSGTGVKHADACAAVGATVLRVASLPAREVLDAMASYRATVLLATPGTVDQLGAEAGEAGTELRALAVRKIVIATQPVSVTWVRAVEEQWDARLFEWYGTASGLVAFSCAEGMLHPGGDRGTLHWDPEFGLYEVLDPSTGQWVEDRARGELVGTPLVNGAEPLFRFRTRDEALFRAPRSCKCGSHWPGIESGTIQRLDKETS